MKSIDEHILTDDNAICVLKELLESMYDEFPAPKKKR